MATVTTKGAGQALLVIDAGTKKPIDIPLKNQEAILAPIVNLRTWINKYVRTGGMGAMVPGGKIKYFAFPKQTTGRDISLSYDDTTGKLNNANGVFSLNTTLNTVGITESTYGTTLVSDEITLQSAQFLKHRFSLQDIKEEGLSNLVSLKFQDFTNEIAENALVALKANLVAAIGTMGKWATDAGHTLPTTGTGLRLQAKDYTTSAADGQQAVNDIVAALQYRDKIGLKGGVEVSYPFARGLNSSTSARIMISATVNTAILTAVQASQNGFLAGVGANKELGIITSISYLGKTVQVEVVEDMPQKAAKDFNWLIIEVGKYGALAFPNKWEATSLVRPSYESMQLMFKELEAIGLLAALKFLQPELMFGSFAA